MSGHTPGPWKAKDATGKYDNRRNSWRVEDEEASCSEAAPVTLDDGTVVAFAVAAADDYFSEDRTDANAALIAAAPDLLEALEELMGELCAKDYDPTCSEWPLGVKARDAIHKAYNP